MYACIMHNGSKYNLYFLQFYLLVFVHFKYEFAILRLEALWPRNIFKKMVVYMRFLLFVYKRIERFFTG